MLAHINQAKHVSALKKYEWLRANGVRVKVGRRVVELKGPALDDYLDKQVWREAHPGKEPEMDIEVGGDDVPAK